MHVYRNRKYEEEIVMLIWHKKGEQRMIETHKQKTRIEAHHKITDSATQTHTHRNKQKTTCNFNILGGLLKRKSGHGHGSRSRGIYFSGD